MNFSKVCTLLLLVWRGWQKPPWALYLTNVLVVMLMHRQANDSHSSSEVKASADNSPSCMKSVWGRWWKSWNQRSTDCGVSWYCTMAYKSLAPSVLVAWLDSAWGWVWLLNVLSQSQVTECDSRLTEWLSLSQCERLECRLLTLSLSFTLTDNGMLGEQYYTQVINYSL